MLKQKFHKAARTVLFLVFIFAFGIVHVIAADRDFSEQENRVLAQMPKLTWERVLSGEFMHDFEDYVSDQFVWKSFWTGLKADAEQASMKQENNDIYYGKDGYLLEQYELPGEQFYQNVAYLNDFAERVKELKTDASISAYFMLAPTSIGIYPEKKPWLAPSEDQKKWLDEVRRSLADSMTFVDVYESLTAHKNESIYFRTDHHWTMRGAYYAYVEVAKAMGLDPYSIDDFERSEVSSDFYGTHYSKAPSSRVQPDSMEVFLPKFDVKYRVTYENDESSMTDALYEWDYLNKRDQYAVFLGGNHSLVKIETHVQNGRKLAVIKDSYAHAMLPFLANHFEEIHVLDLRYNHTNPYDYMEKQGITDVFFLYNIQHFSTDTNMIWLKQ